jgi:hypothetical protein
MTAKFEKHLPVINEIARLMEEWGAKESAKPVQPGETHDVGVPRVTSVSDIAMALGRELQEIITVFEVLRLQPFTWERPSDYWVEDILESCTRHEVSQRF